MGRSVLRNSIAMMGIRFALVTLFLLGVSCTEAKQNSVVIKLQDEPIEFDFEEIIPAGVNKVQPKFFAEREERSAEKVQLQEQAIPFDLDFVIRDKRDASNGETVQLQEEMIPFDFDFVIRDKRDASNGETVQLQPQSIPFDYGFQIREKRDNSPIPEHSIARRANYWENLSNGRIGLFPGN